MHFITKSTYGLLLFLGLVTIAAAQCPPGMRLAGPRGSFCVPGPPDPVPPWGGGVPSREEQIQAIMGPNADRRPDPMQARVSTMESLLELQLLGQQKLRAALDADPKLRELAGGKWEYFQHKNNPKSKDGCAAAYTNLQGSIILTGEADHGSGAFMTFLGLSVPRPGKPANLSVTLDQLDGRPQTVKALNSTTPSGKTGAITIAVPTMKLLLDNMEEKQSFDIAVDGKSVVYIQWSKGVEARNQIRRCVDAPR